MRKQFGGHDEKKKGKSEVNRTNGRGARSDALVLFGVTGDLAHKMIFPALYAMAKRGVLNVPVVGVASSQVESGATAQAREGQHRAIGRDR